MSRLSKTGLLLIILFVFSSLNFSQAQEVKPEEVKAIMAKVADRQIEHFRDIYSSRPEPHHMLAWTNGALYVGMTKWG